MKQSLPILGTDPRALILDFAVVELCRNRYDSLPVSTMWQWCVSRSSIAVVISSHVFGMYAFSVLSGRLADAWGRRPVIASGAVTLAVSCLLAPLSPQVLPLSLALFLLGVGWNFCYVAGSALLADQLRPDERATTQGFNDFLIGLASAAGAVASGMVFAATGYAVMGGLAAAAAVVPLLLVWRSRRGP